MSVGSQSHSRFIGELLSASHRLLLHSPSTMSSLPADILDGSQPLGITTIPEEVRLPSCLSYLLPRSEDRAHSLPAVPISLLL
jgi:hypothetical protein